MKIYIDVGAYIGDTVDCEFLFDFQADKKIAVEANEVLLPYLKKKGFDVIIKKAAWIDNGDITFYRDTSKLPLGSTLFKSKTTGALTPVKQEAFDLSQYLVRFSKDEVLLKMDCEGAEFNILEKMITDGTITIPQTIYVEFHPNKVPQYTTTYKNELIDRLKKLNVDIREWH